jgi:hypothetical protein
MSENESIPSNSPLRTQPRNKGKLMVQSRHYEQATSGRSGRKLQLEKPTRDLALFNLAIDSKLRGCVVVAIRVDDVFPNGYTLDRATVRQKKTGRPVRFELAEQTRQAIDEYLRLNCRKPGDFPVRRSWRQRLRPHDTSICPPRRPVDRQHRSRPAQIRHVLPTPNQRDVDIPPNRQAACGAIIVGPYEDRMHGSISCIEIDEAIEIAEKIEV